MMLSPEWYDLPSPPYESGQRVLLAPMTGAVLWDLQVSAAPVGADGGLMWTGAAAYRAFAALVRSCEGLCLMDGTRADKISDVQAVPPGIVKAVLDEALRRGTLTEDQRKNLPSPPTSAATPPSSSAAAAPASTA